MKPTVILASCGLACLLLGACSSRDEEATAVPDLPLIEAIDFIKKAGAASEDQLRLQAAEKAIALALADEWSDAEGSGWQSIGILNHDRGTLLFQRQDGVPQNVRMTLLDGELVPLWKLTLELGANFSLHRGDLVVEPGMEDRLVKLVTVNENAVDKAPSVLYYAIGEDTCRLVWAEDAAGGWRGDQVAAFHPNLVIAEGKLNSRLLVDQLVALMALSQPAYKDQRADTRVRTILTTLAQSTANNRLALGAARVLTLP